VSTPIFTGATFFLAHADFLSPAIVQEGSIRWFLASFLPLWRWIAEIRMAVLELSGSGELARSANQPVYKEQATGFQRPGGAAKRLHA
jgi:hypothetical protein